MLANPLTLEAGLHFSGGSILSGILNVAGSSTQSALLTVDSTTINNTGSYDLTLNNFAFSGENSSFTNSGTITGHTSDTIRFNIPLYNTGTVSAETGTLVLRGGGTFPGSLPLQAGRFFNSAVILRSPTGLNSLVAGRSN